MSKEIQYCLNCDGYTLLEEDDYDFCKKCQIETLQNRVNINKQLADYLIQQIPESNREQVAKAAWASIK